MEKLTRCNDFMKINVVDVKKSKPCINYGKYFNIYIMNMWRIVLKYQINGNCSSSNTLSLKIEKIVPG